MEKTWIDERAERYREMVLKDPIEARKWFMKEITTPEWERDGCEYETLDDFDRMALKRKHERAMGAYKDREAAKIEAERLRNRSTTERMSDELGDNDTIELDSLVDQYDVIIHRSNQWFIENADMIYERNGLFVSDHKGYYGTYTKEEMREQFPNDARYRTKWASLKARVASGTKASILGWKKSIETAIASRKNRKRPIGGHNNTIVCGSMLIGFFFLIFVAVFVLGLIIAFGVPSLVDLIHSTIVTK